MRNPLLIFLVITYFLASAAHASLYPGVVPANVTEGEEFIVFTKIVDSTSKIITDPASTVSAKYSTTTKTMQPLNNIYSSFPGVSDYWATISEFSAGTADYVNVTASYVDTQLGSVVESAIANVTIGALSIVFTGSTDFILTKKIGENLSLVAYLKDASAVPYIPPIAKINYFVYDYKKMEVFDGMKTFVQCTADETKLCASHIITAEHPAGIISFYASNGTDVGGKNILFIAIPYETVPAVNTIHPAPGDAIEFSLNPNNIYGEISGVDASATLPNGTVVPLYLDNENGYANSFWAPNMSGDYIFNATVNHTIKGITEHNSVFRIHTAYLDMQTGKDIYKQGETVAATLAIYDSNGTAITSNANATITVGGISTEYSNSAISSSNNVRSFAHALALDATEGECILSVNASDDFGRKYFGTIYFHVNALNKTIFATPTHIANAFEAIENTTYTINISSNSTSTINSIHVSASSNIGQYVLLNTSYMSQSLSPNESTSFKLTIIPNESSISSVVSGNLLVNFDGNIILIPIIIENELSTIFDVRPSLSIELLAGAEQEIKINVKNNGTGTMHGLDIDFGSGISSYVSNSNIPERIVAGGTETVSFDIKINDVGAYSGTITFMDRKEAEAPVTLSIDVFNEFSSSISALDSLRKTLNTRILALEANGRDMSPLSSDITGLQGGISELNSIYENGLYSEAKTMIFSLQANANTIQSALDSMES
ncbi:MAG: hypothetical protein KAT91_02315, partial [Candidatus Aenigmarchaeota archaeon]|nr:hypothetical protein [Candidatus Aenigmarchaeota archaeon]